MYIQKIRKVFIILMILLIILLYLQFGRDMDVYNSYVFSVGYYHEQQLKVVINKIWVNDNRKCANDILQRCKANSFKSIVQITLKRNASSATAELLFHF